LVGWLVGYKNEEKSKAFSQQVTSTQTVDAMVGFHPYSDIRHTWEGTAVSCTRRPHGKKERTLKILSNFGFHSSEVTSSVPLLKFRNQ
jgi:hypothetical protein